MYGEFNQGRSSLQDEFREGRPKSLVVPETIDATRQLILQDRHVTYREFETTLGISRTSIHSILHEHLTVKKNLFALDHTQFVNLNGEYFKKTIKRLPIINIYFCSLTPKYKRQPSYYTKRKVNPKLKSDI